MAGITSLPIPAVPLTSSGTVSGTVGIASVTGWTIGTQVAIADDTITTPVMATLVGVDTTNNLLFLRTDYVPSEGWIQDGFSPQLTPPPQLPQASKNATDMSAWTTGHSATVTQVPTFIYTTLVTKPSKGVKHFFDLTPSLFSNSRATPAFQDTLGNGTKMLLLGPNTIRVEPLGIRQENPATNVIYYSQLIGFNDGTNGWTAVDSTSSMTYALNSADVLAPDGTQTASKLTWGACSGANYAFWSNNGYTTCNSVWLRTLTGTAEVILFDSSVVHQLTCNVTTTWQRFSFIGNIVGYLGFDTASATPSTTGITIYAWGWQAETTAFPTSYFPTNTNTYVGSNAFTTNSSFLDGVSMAKNATDPNGVANNAWTLTANAGNSQHREYLSLTNSSSTVSLTCQSGDG